VSQVNEAASVTLLPQAKHSWYLGANSLSASCSIIFATGFDAMTGRCCG